MAPGDQAVFHLIVHGSCVIERPDSHERLSLQAGDMAVMTRGSSHIIHAPAGLVESADPACVFGFEQGVLAGTTGLICGYFCFDPLTQNPLIDALPDCVVVRATTHPDPQWLQHLIALLLAESMAQATAGETIIEKLSDVLFIHVLRSFLAESPQHKGVLAGFADPALRPVLEMIHREPQRPWSIADFSQAANLSRSSFIERFTRLVGISPMAYLTNRRLDLAYRLLTEGRQKVLDIALSCGYESEASFSKAFKRCYGVAPSIARRQNALPTAKGLAA
jgi:AraC-like DNA-binding protein